MAKKEKPDERDAEISAATSVPGYTKQQFLSSEQYTFQQKDVLNALLKDGERYSTQQVSKMIEKFLNKEVC